MHLRSFVPDCKGRRIQCGGHRHLPHAKFCQQTAHCTTDSMSAVTHILRRLCPRDRARAALVNKVDECDVEWAHAAEHPSLWETIDLSGNQQAGALLSQLLRNPLARQHLRDLVLEFAVGVNDDVLAGMSGIALESLNLNACQQVTDASLVPLLWGSPKLTALSLYWNLNVGDAVLQAAASSCHALRSLNVSGCKRISDVGVAAVAAAWPQLTELDLTRCVAVTDEGLEAVGAHCRQLRVLRLYANSGITDVGVKAIAKLPHLEVLDLTGAAFVTDVGVWALAACSNLRQLTLSWCVLVGDAAVVAIAAGCRKLELLSLHGLRNLTDRAVEALSKHCARTLHTLDINGCTGVQRRGRGQLREVLPQLQTFVVHT